MQEISEIRHSNSKLKKMLAETNTELGHAVRRAEQYESEVKRLRSRVEELKRELATAEDELDAACNHVRRLQRANEEMSGQAEGLQLQIQHLQTRYDIIYALFSSINWILMSNYSNKLHTGRRNHGTEPYHFTNNACRQ